MKTAAVVLILIALAGAAWGVIIDPRVFICAGGACRSDLSIVQPVVSEPESGTCLLPFTLGCEL